MGGVLTAAIRIITQCQAQLLCQYQLSINFTLDIKNGYQKLNTSYFSHDFPNYSTRDMPTKGSNLYTIGCRFTVKWRSLKTVRNTMSSKKLHKVLGITLTLPILGWALTGIVFLTKPGYEGAYERLVVKTYPLEQTISFTPEGHWHQALSQRTILGNHLLLSNGKEQVHLHPATLEPYLKPSKKDIRALIEDAITVNPDRYGKVVDVTPSGLLTDTGVEITLDWPSLSLKQHGVDTEVIGTLYKIHYLQWLGAPLPNKILGGLGIILLLTLVVLGLANLRSRAVKD